MHRFITSVGLSVGVGLGLVRAMNAQEITSASYERGPRFLLAMATKVVPVDVRKTPVLARRLNLELEGATLKQALAEIAAQSGLVLAYSDDAVPLEKRVHLRAEVITAAAALTDVLFDAGVDVVFKADGSAALVKRPPAPQNGSVSGRVTDAKTSAAVVGATVVIERTTLSATTDNDGRYRVPEVPPGTHTVRARYIGYAPRTMSVMVSADEEAVADFALQRSVQRLEEVVTTGTMVPTEVKALPTPISVIGEAEIAQQQPRNTQQLLRQQVPGAVSWDLANDYFTPYSSRGATTITAGTSGVKVFVDGVPTASSVIAGIDPSSIERVEVLRGPQAATIYGSDAIGGVIGYFTKRGDPGLTRPLVSGEAGLGVLQTPYTGKRTAFRQSYRAALRGGSADMSYNFGAGYVHTGDYLPNGEISRQSQPSVFGGMHFTRNIISVDLSGRYYVQDFGDGGNPALASTGFAVVSKPFYTPTEVTNQSIAARVDVSPSRWWQHSVTVGTARLTMDFARERGRLTSPGDTLLLLTDRQDTRRFISYNTTLRGDFGSGFGGTLLAGVDHYTLPATLFSTSGALNTTGSVEIAPNQGSFFTRTKITNTGYFAQGQLGIKGVLFLTAGLRAEENSEFGDSLGTPLAPRVGLAYLHNIGATTLKVRGAWGRAIKAPSPGLKDASVGPTSATLANPQLAPERQQGWDGGVDIVFGELGSLSVSYYDQTADDLIQSVLLQTSPVRIDQFQNVGSARNRGIEVEGRLSLKPVDIRAQYGYARAKIERLAPGFVGDLRVGDQVPGTPKHTAGASVAIEPYTGTSLSAGITYVGSWRNYDYFAFFGCFGGTRPCQASTRDYIVDYPSLLKVNATVSQRLTARISAFLGVENMTNDVDYEYSNLLPVMGRVTTFGLRLQS